MSRQMSKIEFPVSTRAIKNEIRKAAKNLHAMEKKLRAMEGKASSKKLQAVESELKILKDFCHALGNIECI
jgi:predicted DNA-binding protein YlxM (UPF0122 family)